MAWPTNGMSQYIIIITNQSTNTNRGTASSYDLWAKAIGDDSYRFDQVLPYFQKSVQFTPPPNTDLRGGPPVAYDESAFSSSGGPLNVAFWNYYIPASDAIRKGLEKLGFKETGKIQSGSLLGFAQYPATLHPDLQIRDSSQTAFLETTMENPDSFQTYPGTLAKQVLFDGAKRATGVRVDTAGTEYVLSAKKEVILAAGVVGYTFWLSGRELC